MAIATPITLKRLKEVLSYDPLTGEWTWLIYVGRMRPGDRAGTPDRDVGNRLLIKVDGRQYQAARLAWLYMKGHWPPRQIDHEDTDASNGRWLNLRLASISQNGANRGKQSNNSSGHKGVSWQCGKWRAKIACRGVLYLLGRYDNLNEAAAAYERKAIELFGEFARV